MENKRASASQILEVPRFWKFRKFWKRQFLWKFWSCLIKIPWDQAKQPCVCSILKASPGDFKGLWYLHRLKDCPWVRYSGAMAAKRELKAWTGKSRHSTGRLWVSVTYGQAGWVKEKPKTSANTFEKWGEFLFWTLLRLWIFYLLSLSG